MVAKAPRWLRESFRDGVDERYLWENFDLEGHGGRRESHAPGVTSLHSAYSTADIACWLAQHDPRRRPCEGRLERFHFIGRQRVENALGALLPDLTYRSGGDLIAPILLAAWDPRNGGISCQHHHRRFDAHATPTLTVPRDALPDHVLDFVRDWGLDEQIEHRFPFA